jgi:hypothetical protein
MGPCQDNKTEDAAVNCCAIENEGLSLSEEINRLYRHNFLMREGEKASPEESHPSRDDARATKIIQETLEFDEESGHYRCGLPWKNGRQGAASKFNVEVSRRNAIDWLVKEGTKLRKDPQRCAGVWSSMNEIIGEGHAKRVDNPEVPPGTPLLYLPIHIVTQKPGKCRVCQDGAAKCHGVCLNDELLAGPDLLNRLVGILLRFRRHKVALSANIKGFFHQVYMRKDDSPAFRFYWFEDETMESLVEYEMVVHLFGAKSSQFVATYVLRYHGKKISGEVEPEVVHAIMKAFYVDDFLKSYPTVEEARKVRIALMAALGSQGFDLTKWRCTHPSALEEAKTLLFA